MRVYVPHIQTIGWLERTALFDSVEWGWVVIAEEGDWFRMSDVERA